MNELLNLLKNYSLEDIIKIENSDRQFLAIKNLFSKLKNKSLFLSLVLVNALVCYQLSSKWEDYFEEFSCFFINNKVKNKQELLPIFKEFLKNSKWNKRLLNMKIKRLEKIMIFLDIFIWKEEFYYENMEILNIDLAKYMNQKLDAKTIVFAIKIFSYWARLYFDKMVYFPKSINIPIDSRLTAIYEKYCSDKDCDINEFYKTLSEKLNIPPLHLDSLIWLNNF